MENHPTTASEEDFPYPSLTPGEDAIRILTIDPGNFDDQITCTLTPITFGAKPRYIALSYTWGDPYPGDTKASTLNQGSSTRQFTSTRLQTPSVSQNMSQPSTEASATTERNGADFISVNNHQFPVTHNLSIALRNLRSPTHPLVLWVDAICIDQNNRNELNMQVAMMSFIYRRAAIVVAWLGVKNYGRQLQRLSMYNEWKGGETRYLAALQQGSIRPRYSLEPDEATFYRITESSYWTRVWIVQEVCLPQHLIFVYGSKVWTYEDLRHWKDFRKASTTVARPETNQPLEIGIESMVHLLDTRESKYSEEMTLGYLIESFSKAACSEVRDKVYGLLGVANDINPYSSVDGAVDSIEQYIESLDLQDEALPIPPKGRARFKVDYSKSFYEVWADVLRYLYFWAKGAGGRYTEEVLSAALPLIPSAPKFWASLREEERHLTIVRTSAVVQEALGQKVGEEVTNAANPKESTLLRQPSELNLDDRTKNNYRNPTIRAIGYLSGEILEIGPEYTSLMSSFHSHQEWQHCLETHYNTPFDLGILRRTDDGYMAKLLTYGDKDVSRIQEIKSRRVVAWNPTGQKPQNSDPRFNAEYEKIWEDTHERKQNHSNGQNICICTGYQIAIVPSSAKPGDVIVRFWDCNAAIVMRPVTNVAEDQTTSFMLVGRADVADVVYKDEVKDTTPRDDANAKRGFNGDLSPNYAKDPEIPGAVYVDLDFNTLQLITASVATGS
ncbi:heterokaryon incompatibility protein-domain-containing protein [Hypoxylon crocopeplum]|nr:heterokaryon incompatibility protein-domain-containing protein [Hypoxylon crocopeplum]